MFRATSHERTRETMTDHPYDGDGYIFALNLKGQPMIARPSEAAFQGLDDITDEIAAVRARHAQIQEEAERWRPLGDN
jgi:hypothetical protein